jgi:hypothetical protein
MEHDKLTPLDVALHMQKIVIRLAEVQQRSDSLIEAKAKTTQDYKTSRAVHSMKAKGTGMQVTLIKHHAEGEASKEEYDMIVATESLKAHWIYMENLRAQLNAFQSINKNLANI